MLTSELPVQLLDLEHTLAGKDLSAGKNLAYWTARSPRLRWGILPRATASRTR